MRASAGWLAVDPLKAKYPGFSPYNFALNSPISIIDFDGADVLLATYKCIENCGYSSEIDTSPTYESTAGLTNKTTIKAMKAFLSTPEGYDYVSKFAKAGDNILGFEFKKDGKFSNHDLQISDYLVEDAGALGQTRYSISYDRYQLRNGKVERISKGNEEYSININFKESFLAERDYIDGGQGTEYTSVPRINVSLLFFTTPEREGNVERKALTIGHEAFIHSINLGFKALYAIADNNLSIAVESFLQKFASGNDHGHLDHKN